MANKKVLVNGPSGTHVNVNTPGASYLKKDTGKFMGTAGLGALIGMGVELAKLRRKILNKWEQEKQEALEKGEIPPPRPDTSKGALLAMLKGAGFGAVAGGALGKTPIIGTALNDTAASIHGAARKYLSGSRLTDGNKAAFFSMLNYVGFDDFKPFYQFDPQCFNVEPEVLNRIELENFAKKTNTHFTPKSTNTKSSNTNYNIIPTSALQPKGLIQENKYVSQDKKLLGKTKSVLPVAGAILGGTTAAYKAYKRDLELWEQLKIENASKGLPQPTKPILADYIGDFATGGIVGAAGGVLINKTGIGKTINSHLGDNSQNDWIINRKQANEAVEQIQRGQKRTGLTTFSDLKNWVGKVSRTPFYDVNKEYMYKHLINNSDIKNLNFSYDEYKETLLKRGLKTSLTEEEFNKGMQNFNSKAILIDLYKEN